MHESLSLFSIVLLLVAGGCTSSGPSAGEPPGYDGPLPGPEARAVLQELEGDALEVEAESSRPVTWTVGPFGVVPNSVSPGGKGPVVILRSGDRTAHLPVETDGDVADLYERVRGRSPEAIAGSTSESYRNASLPEPPAASATTSP